MRDLHAKTPDGQILPENAPQTDSTMYVYVCPLHERVRLGVSTPFQREP